jgi:tetratricopeptide (TPR) repeat protein
MRSAFVFVLFAGMVMLAGQASGKPMPGDLLKAQQLLKSGEPDAALKLVDPIVADALAGDAKDPAATCPSAAAAFLQKMLGLKATVTVENDWCSAMLVRGYALNELKRSAEAETMLATLVGHAPDSPHYLSEYAFTVRTNGDLAKSLSLYQQAAAVARRMEEGESRSHWLAVALRGQGFNYGEMKRWDEAEKAYRDSLKNEPGNKIALNELQWIAEQRGATTN